MKPTKTVHVRRTAITLLALGMLVSSMMMPLGASADHSWNGYHWLRASNPFTLPLADNMSWPASYLYNSAVAWSESAVLDTVVVGGGGVCETPRVGMVEVCNADYGANGWLGLAEIWISPGGHITHGAVRMNDFYFVMNPYSDNVWRNSVMCQEIGHTLGLGHTDEIFNNANLGTCMDYTNDPDGGPGGAAPLDPSNEWPNQHDYDELELIYAHGDMATPVVDGARVSSGGLARASGVVPSGAARGGTSEYRTDLGGGVEVITFVIWADEQLIAEAAAEPTPTVAADDGGYQQDPGSGETGVSYATGSSVITTDSVNLRVEPSLAGEVVDVLPAGTEGTVTGPAVQADGRTWIPVRVVTANGAVDGYVAAEFLAPA